MAAEEEEAGVDSGGAGEGSIPPGPALEVPRLTRAGDAHRWGGSIADPPSWEAAESCHTIRCTENQGGWNLGHLWFCNGVCLISYEGLGKLSFHDLAVSTVWAK